MGSISKADDLNRAKRSIRVLQSQVNDLAIKSANIDKVETRVTSLEKEVTHVNEIVESVSTKLDELIIKTEEMDADMAQLTDKVNGHATSIADLDGRLTLTDGKLVEVTNEVLQIGTRMDEIENQVNDTQQQIAAANAIIEQMEAVINEKQRVKSYFMKLQGNLIVKYQNMGDVRPFIMENGIESRPFDNFPREQGFFIPSLQKSEAIEFRIVPDQYPLGDSDYYMTTILINKAYYSYGKRLKPVILDEDGEEEYVQQDEILSNEEARTATMTINAFGLGNGFNRVEVHCSAGDIKSDTFFFIDNVPTMLSPRVGGKVDEESGTIKAERVVKWMASMYTIVSDDPFYPKFKLTRAIYENPFGGAYCGFSRFTHKCVTTSSATSPLPPIVFQSEGFSEGSTMRSLFLEAAGFSVVLASVYKLAMTELDAQLDELSNKYEGEVGETFGHIMNAVVALQQSSVTAQTKIIKVDEAVELVCNDAGMTWETEIKYVKHSDGARDYGGEGVKTQTVEIDMSGKYLKAFGGGVFELYPREVSFTKSYGVVEIDDSWKLIPHYSTGQNTYSWSGVGQTKTTFDLDPSVIEWVASFKVPSFLGTDAESTTLHCETSEDGVNWTPRAIPMSAQLVVEGGAIVQWSGVIDEQVISHPEYTPTSTYEDYGEFYGPLTIVHDFDGGSWETKFPSMENPYQNMTATFDSRYVPRNKPKSRWIRNVRAEFKLLDSPLASALSFYDVIDAVQESQIENNAVAISEIQQQMYQMDQRLEIIERSFKTSTFSVISGVVETVSSLIPIGSLMTGLMILDFVLIFGELAETGDLQVFVQKLVTAITSGGAVAYKRKGDGAENAIQSNDSAFELKRRIKEIMESGEKVYKHMKRVMRFVANKRKRDPTGKRIASQHAGGVPMERAMNMNHIRVMRRTLSAAPGVPLDTNTLGGQLAAAAGRFNASPWHEEVQADATFRVSGMDNRVSVNMNVGVSAGMEYDIPRSIMYVPAKKGESVGATMLFGEITPDGEKIPRYLDPATTDVGTLEKEAIFYWEHSLGATEHGDILDDPALTIFLARKPWEDKDNELNKGVYLAGWKGVEARIMSPNFVMDDERHSPWMGTPEHVAAISRGFGDGSDFSRSFQYDLLLNNCQATAKKIYRVATGSSVRSGDKFQDTYAEDYMGATLRRIQATEHEYDPPYSQKDINDMMVEYFNNQITNKLLPPFELDGSDGEKRANADSFKLRLVMV